MTILESSPRVRGFPGKEAERETIVKRSVCIVTPDAHGLSRNGEIGTATYHQARYFASQGIEVTLLYTHEACESFDRGYWRDHYLDHSVRLLFLNEEVKQQNTMFGRWFLEHSLMVKNYLVNKTFDCIYFQDWQAAGFHSIQAKHVGLAFQETQLAVVVNSPQEWIDESAGMWAEAGDLYCPYLKWCERYCCRHADFLQAPSQYVFDWLEQHAWSMAPKRYITPTIHLDGPLDGSGNALVPATTATDKLRLAFFSRLETCKGLEIFLDALEALADKSRVEIPNQNWPKGSFAGECGIWVSLSRSLTRSTATRRSP
jgi:glycosyltransferase involved in cell wall biosynthesis